MKTFKLLAKRSGVALLATVLLMSLILFLSLYFLNFSVTENRISKSQTQGEKSYYLAEAGVADMIWKLKNDATYKNNFETNAAWTTSFTKNDPFGSGTGSYTVSISNTSLAHGQIESTGTVTGADGKVAKRVIKTKVFKAIGQSPLEDTAAYSDGNIDISDSRVNFYNGNVHSNNNIIINGSSFVYAEEDINATGNYLVNWQASTTVGGTVHSADYPPAASEISMPAIDFNSSATSSYKNIASTTYTPAQFDDLFDHETTVTLDSPVTYVSGNASVPSGKNLVLNGLLVVENDFSITKGSVTMTSASGTPAGILAARKVTINEGNGALSVTGSGLIYAVDQLDVIGLQKNGSGITLTGGLVSRKLTITSCAKTVNITFATDIMADVFRPTTFSPTITVEHWEEEY